MYSNALKQYRLFALDCVANESDELALVDAIQNSLCGQRKKKQLSRRALARGRIEKI